MQSYRKIGSLFMAALFISGPAVAASDPQNDDCRDVMEFRSLSQDINRYNYACPSGLAICDAIQSKIEERSSNFPGVVIQTNKVFQYDLKNMSNILKLDASVETCDPASKDCVRNVITWKNFEKAYPSAEAQGKMLRLLPYSNFAEPLK